MARVLIFDLPVRLFHWLLAGGIVLAFAFAQFGDEDEALFPYHAMIGIVLGAMLALRLIWGLVGTRYARFTSFLFGPVAVTRYLKGMSTGKAERHIGHNPASSWAIFLMYAGVATVVGSGLMMSRGIEAGEEVHEVAVYALLAVAAIHVLGVIVHTVRQRENITLSMITGRKDAEEQAAIRSAAPVSALVGLAIVVMLGVALLWSYDPARKQTTLPLFGTSIGLGEAEHDSHETADHHAGD